MTEEQVEHVDAIVVGARCAGSAAATALARAGRRVVALDSAKFPSTTVSTHLLFAGGVAELSRLGALERVEQLGPPRHMDAYIGTPGAEVRGTYSPVDGIAYGMCVRRAGLDQALVDTARAAGADVREGVKVTGLVQERGRVVGVRASARGAHAELELRAPLVIGADGRRSTVARMVGADAPYLVNANGRACYYAYYDDPRTEWRGTAAMWLAGRELGTAFPTDGGLVLCLLMPPKERAEEFRLDLEGEYDRTVALLPGLAERLDGCTRSTKIVQSVEQPSYFRRSSGPGWALAGDAGHFKDPVTAQGIRDALRFGRLLGETAAPVLDNPARLDAAVRAWERRREAECRETYHWTNRLARADEVNPLQEQMLRMLAAEKHGARRLLDVYSRTRRPGQLLTPAFLARCATAAFTRRDTDRRALLAILRSELRTEAAVRTDLIRAAKARSNAGS
ncbi:NAD(P)/FAD-dependent oxidoreductase [Yinghuangia seranimata]|uniref:NAD(P)/FAD-dependent oxidoreductase n=1 Tax=Yinghuangia seranimata TaxID=408067 RepID=UPI00248BC63C|nr:FAD-dependent monooxygenase [Yinghuangia seranimata]MDI2128216.1 FAD-dependent monooxygenase [Yinghuangia seranimata]